jgi:hypothetical protein
MATHYEDIEINQGADFAMEIELTDANGAAKNLTGYSIESKLKKNLNADSADTVSFTAIIASPETDGVVTLSLTNTQTDLLNHKKRYLYDVELSHQDSAAQTFIERIMEGQAFIKPSVTK